MNTSLRFPMILSVVIISSPTGFLSMVHADAVPSLDEILQMEKQIIESRRTIRSGRVVVRIRTPVYKREPSLVGTEKMYVTNFEGDKIRFDLKLTKGKKTSREQRVFTKDTYIRMDLDARSADLYGPETRPETSREFPDPRRLGLICWFYDSINKMGYEDILLNPNRDQFKIESGVEAGEPVWKVAFRITVGSNALSAEYWLSKAKSHLPVYVAVAYPEGEGETVRSIKTKLKKYGPDEVWFPSEVILRFTHEGQVTIEEITTVEDAVFGQDIDDKVFTLAGMDTQKGTVVVADGKVLVWDGERLVARLGLSGLEQPPRSTWVRFWLVSNAVILALIAALIWYRRKARR